MEHRPRDETAELLASAPWVRRLARRLVGDAHLAEDVAQEALTAAVARREGFTSAGALRRWLAGATRHLAWAARDREREQRARERRAARAEHGTTQGGGADERLRLHRRLVEAVAALDPAYREVLVLRFFDELPPRAIARRLAISPEAARQRLSRGLARLRARLDLETPGGRGAWCAGLLSLIEAGSLSARATLTWKALAMGTKTTLVVAGTLGLAVWWFAAGQGHGPALAPVEVAAGADARPPSAAALGAQPGTSGRAAAALAPVPSATTLVVRIVAGEGTLLTGVRAWWLEDGNPDPPRELEAPGGQVRLEGADAGGTLLARAPGHPPGALVLAQRRGEHDLVLGPGAVVSGRLLVDGAAPRGPVRLRFFQGDDRLGFLPEPTRPIAREVLGLGAEEVRLSDAEGRFRVEGLSPEWFGRVQLPNTHWFARAPAGAALSEDDQDVLLLPGPGEYLLHLTRLPCLRGRVVWADDRAPVSGASLHVQARFADGEESPSIGLAADGDGRFEIGLWPGSSGRRAGFVDPASRPAFELVSAWVYPRGGLRTGFEFQRAELGPDGDLGALAVERGRTIHFRVRDEHGAPLPGAHAFAQSLSAPTDALGRGVLAGVPPGTERVRVGASGRRIVFAALGAGATAEDPLEVVLGPGNRLALRLVDGSGARPAGAHLVLACRVPLFEAGGGLGGWGPTSLHYQLLGDAFGGASWSDEGGRVSLELDEQGWAELFGLADHVDLEARVLSRLGTLLLEERFRGPGGGERLERVLTLEGEPISLTGRVVDEAGGAVVNADVRLRVAGGSARARTGRDGAFALSDLRPRDEPVAVEVIQSGRAALRLEQVPLVASHDLGQLVMPAGRELVVELVDDGGQPVEFSSIAARAPGFAVVRSEDRAPGVEVLADLPPVEVTLVLRYGGRPYEWTVGRDQMRARLTVPRHGALELLAPGDAPVPDQGWLAAVVTALDEPGVEASLHFDDQGATGVEPTLPGRYSVRVERVQWLDGERRVQPLPGSWEVEVRAGETTRRRLGD